MKNKTLLTLAFCYGILNPFLIYLRGGFWLLIPEMVSFFIGAVIFVLGFVKKQNIKPMLLAVGLLPMIGYLFQLNLPDKEISYHLKSQPNDYILILFNQVNGEDLNTSFF